jgi:hypothetical protein
LHIPSRFSIISVSSFSPITSCTNLATNRIEQFPLVVVHGPTDFVFPPDFTNNDCSVFTISPDDNSFVFGTAFEAILLLKHLLFFAESPDERTLLKSAYLDLFIAQSPFVLIYLARLSDHISLQIPSSPFDFSKFYREQLIILGSFVRRGGFSTFHDQFLSQEARVLENPVPREICCHFPEWLSITPDSPSSPLCRVALPPYDPVSNQFDAAGAIQTFRYFTRQYPSLVGFPFWEALPYWLRIHGVQDEDDNATQPTTEISEGVLRVSNSSRSHFQLFLSARWPANAILLVDSMPEFPNPTMLTGPLLSAPITLSPGQALFLSLIDFPAGWTSVGLQFARQAAGVSFATVDLEALKPAFTADMRAFALEWSPRDTAELLLAVPRDAFRQPFFSAVGQIAAATALAGRFPLRVVLLRAMILHHFNYIRTRCYDRVHTGLWDSMTSFVAWEDAADLISRDITRAPGQQCPNFTIDRHAAQQLCAAGHGDPGRSIISQLTAALKPLPLAFLQCRRRPWQVKFAGEAAVDVGGPGRELMTDVARSIFEPTTRLMIPTPNRREGIGAFQDTYVPLDVAGTRADDYKTIGHFIGMVLRSGLSQDLPFAPLVWKYLAGEKLGQDDVFEVDDRLKETLRVLREGGGMDGLIWSCDHWDGTVYSLPGHAPGALVRAGEVEQFCQECIQFRLVTLKPVLKLIRGSFRYNVGFKKRPLLSGSLLSRMAQGIGAISCDALRAITVYRDYGGPTDPYIERFWRAVARMNLEQLKLLLKFVTTLTRMPNPSLHPDFRIQIDRLVLRNPDQSLPTASTCFNRLHLPMYSDDETCYQKLLYAVQFCQTMEMK